jgi:hypothetical protein
MRRLRAARSFKPKPFYRKGAKGAKKNIYMKPL